MVRSPNKADGSIESTDYSLSRINNYYFNSLNILSKNEKVYYVWSANISTNHDIPIFTRIVKL